MKLIVKNELQEMFRLHRLYLEGSPEGKRLRFSSMEDLSGCDFRGFDLTKVTGFRYAINLDKAIFHEDPEVNQTIIKMILDNDPKNTLSEMFMRTYDQVQIPDRLIMSPDMYKAYKKIMKDE